MVIKEGRGSNKPITRRVCRGWKIGQVRDGLGCHDETIPDSEKLCELGTERLTGALELCHGILPNRASGRAGTRGSTGRSDWGVE